MMSMQELEDEVARVLEGNGTVSRIFPNPWLRIPPDTWPFLVLDSVGKKIPVEIWPVNSRHDSYRWIRSMKPGEPLARLDLHWQPKEQVFVLRWRIHFDLDSMTQNVPEDADRHTQFNVMLRQWSTAVQIFLSTPDDDQKLSEENVALELLRRSMQIHEVHWLPGLNSQEKRDWVEWLMSRFDGIDQRHPIAAKAEALLRGQ